MDTVNRLIVTQLASSGIDKSVEESRREDDQFTSPNCSTNQIKSAGLLVSIIKLKVLDF